MNTATILDFVMIGCLVVWVALIVCYCYLYYQENKRIKEDNDRFETYYSIIEEAGRISESFMEDIEIYRKEMEHCKEIAKNITASNMQNKPNSKDTTTKITFNGLGNAYKKSLQKQYGIEE